MRYWSEQHVFNFDDVSTEERARLAGRVYDCIGRQLARRDPDSPHNDLPLRSVLRSPRSALVAAAQAAEPPVCAAPEALTGIEPRLDRTAERGRRQA